MTKVIDTFLENWKQSAKQHYVATVNQYKELTKSRRDLMEKYGLYTTRPNQELPQDYVDAKNSVKAFFDIRSKSEVAIIEKCIYADNEGNKTETLDSFLEKLLDKEVQNKKAVLIQKIKAKAGEIIDADKLYIGADGSINGYVLGEIKEVQVETIYAGGYNVQCLHYRVLVK
jgi:ferritin-like protein